MAQRKNNQVISEQELTNEKCRKGFCTLDKRFELTLGAVLSMSFGIRV